jgi:hypothetical protein
MKYHFGLVWLMVVLVLMIDSFLFWRWRKNGLFNNLTGKLAAFFIFGFMPLTAIAGFIHMGLRMPTTDSAQIYVDFGWFLLFFLMVYIAKFFYSGFNGLQLILNRRLRTPEEKVHHYPRITRRKFLSQMGIIMATAPFVSLLFGAFQGRFAFYTRHIRLSFPNLPDGFDGMRIAQISDLHIGSFGDNRDPMREAVKLVNAEHPDMILFTGDLVNNFAEEVNGWEAIFAELKAPMGKYSILGNHDYGNYSRWSSNAQKAANFQGILDGHRKIGFMLMRNESLVLNRKGDTMGLGGVENWGTASQPRKGDLIKASEGIKDQSFNLLMSHDPDHWDKQILPQDFFDLTLAGHTHGMQFGIEKGDFRWSPAQYIQKRWAGLYREGNKFLYVNRGLGYHGLPARVGMPPEITIIELRKGPVGSGTL